MKVRMICLVCLVASLLGCATVSTTEIMNSWMGSHISRVVMSWGPPTQVVSDSAGGYIYIWLPKPMAPLPPTIEKRGYTQWNSLTQRFEYRERTSAVQSINDALIQIAINNHNNSYKMFYVRSDGVVYHWRARGQ